MAEPQRRSTSDHRARADAGDVVRLPRIAAQRLAWQDRRRILLDDVARVDEARARVTRLALRQGFVLRRSQAIDLGMTDAELRRLVRRGEWSTPHYGVLAVIGEPTGVEAPVLAAAAVALARPGAVVSHRSAALVRGLPVRLSPPLPETTLRPASTGRRFGSSLHRAGLTAADVTGWYGIRVTTVARTIVDLARLDLRSGLMAADAALAEDATTRRALRRAVQRCTGWPGVRSARRVLDLARAQSESPLESLTRLCLVDHGLPEPELQVRIVDDLDGWSCRVDMLYAVERLVIEADGRIKYAGDALWQEKIREERLGRLGYRVLRVVWDDVAKRPDETAMRVRRALASPLRRPESAPFRSQLRGEAWDPWAG